MPDFNTVISTLRTGLATYLSGIGGTSVVQLQDIAPMKASSRRLALPTIRYQLSNVIQYPGRNFGMNPTVRSSEKAIALDPALLTSTTSDIAASVNELTDTSQDFVALDIHPWSFVDTSSVGSAPANTARVLSILSTDTLLLDTPGIFNGPNIQYSIFDAVVEKTYEKSQTMGFFMSVLHKNQGAAFQLASDISNFFILGTKADALLKPLGWRIFSPGQFVPTDFVESEEKRVNRLDSVVGLLGIELVKETVTDISNVITTPLPTNAALPTAAYPNQKIEQAIINNLI